MISLKVQTDSKSKDTILGLERNIFFAGLTSFTMDTATKMIYSVMSMFLLSIGASKTLLSLIEGIAESTASLLKAFSGWWSDKVGKNKPFMLVGYALSAVVVPLYALAIFPVHVLALRFVERVGKGIRTAPRDSLIAGSVKQGNTGRGFGFHKAMDNCGAVIGPLISFAIISAFSGNYRLVFIISAIPALLSIVIISKYIKEAGKDKDLPKTKITLKAFPKRFYAFLAIIFVFTLGNSSDQLLLVKANDVGINALYIPLVYLVYNAVSVLFAVPMGILSDRIGREKLIIFGYTAYSLIYFGFGRTGQVSAVIGLFALYGLYSAATDGVQKALVADLADKDKMGTAMGIYNSLLGVTLLPASLIAGVLYDKVNNRAPFYFGAVMAILAALMMVVFYRRKIVVVKSA